tara:strand:+ start:34 stop:354 length:321 start_codon:yes stop_codon:yes gene_type:complete
MNKDKNFKTLKTSEMSQNTTINNKTLNSSEISKNTTISNKTLNSSKKDKSSENIDNKLEIYEKYKIDKDIIKIIDNDENKFKILLEEIYLKKIKELKELVKTPYNI